MALRLNTRKSGIYIEKEIADKLCTLQDDAAVRLYLCLAMYPEYDEEKLARKLILSPQCFANAKSALVRLGLVTECTEASVADLAQKRQALSEPNYTAAEVTQLVTEDIAFAQIVKEAEIVLHPCLTESDLRELMTIYRYFGMPAECLIMLMHFARARMSRQNGRRLSLSMIKKEAYRWLENGVTNAEAAERFIANENRLYEAVEHMEQAIGYRATKQDERRMLRSWAEMGFGAEAVAYAMEITVKRIGEAELKYAAGILKGWKSAGLTTVEEIRAYETRREKEHEKARLAYEKRTAAHKPPQISGSFSSAELDAIRQMQEYMSHGGEEE